MILINIIMADYSTILDAFVKKMCVGRPPSHGYQHMIAVCDTAVHIYGTTSHIGLVKDIVTVAMLHDVADHKYDKDGSLKAAVLQFVTVHHDCPQEVMNTIDAISFSRELKKGKRWFEKSLGPQWTRVRDTVSDADKLEAIGSVGVHRCMAYHKELDPTAHDKANVHALLQHMLDKLLLLKDEYIVTKEGRKLAQPRHDEMVRMALRYALNIIK
jgi:HD superfamily phosphodiesterase